MLTITLDKVLEARGKTIYWLAKETEIDSHNLMKLCRKKTVQIRFDTVEKICAALDCTPNDFIKYEK